MAIHGLLVFQRCSSERSGIDMGIYSVFYGSGVRRLSGLSVLVWLYMYCRCFNAARLRGLRSPVLMCVYVRCFMKVVVMLVSHIRILRCDKVRIEKS